MNNDLEKDVNVSEENENLPAKKDFEFLGDPNANVTEKKKPSLRRFSPIIALCVVAVLLFGTVAVLRKTAPEDTTENMEDDDKHVIPIFDFTGTDADRFEIKNTNDEFAFVKKLEKTFYIEGKEEFPVANSTILSTLTYFGSLEAVTIVETMATDLAQYGLDKPLASLKWIKGNTVHTLDIGTVATSGNYYVRADGGDAVYTMDSTVATYFLSPRMDFYNTALFDFDQNTDGAYINKFVFSKKGADDIIVELQDLADDSLESAYLIVEPIRHSFSVTIASLVTELMSNLTSLTVYDDDTSAENLAKYGLDDPEYSFSFTNVQQVNTIHIGNKSNEGYYYAYAEDHDFIYIIDEETINVLTYDVAGYCETMSYTRSYETVDKIRINGGGKSYSIDITGTADDNDLKAYINNKYVEYDTFASLYAHIISIEIKEMGEKSPSDQLLVTIEVDTIDGETDVIKYYKKSDLDCFYELNGEGMLLVSTAKVEQILEFAQKLYDGEEIVLDW